MKKELSKQIEYFKERQEAFAAQHYQKFVLIYNRSEIGFYDSGGQAYKDAVKRQLESGKFLIRQCLRRGEEPAAIFHSRVS